MAQRLEWRSGGGEQARYEKAWLAMLVETFDTVSREPGRPDAATIAGLKSQLAHPAAVFASSFVALH